MDKKFLKLDIPKINLPFKLPFLKPNDAFAIDIGSHSIKILKLKNQSDKYHLVKWAVLPFPEPLKDIPPQEKRATAIELISHFVSKEKLGTKNVTTSLSGNSIITRYVKFPKLSKEELLKTIKFEAEPYIPFDINDVDIGFHILKDVMEDNKRKMETILVASKKDRVMARLELLNDLNLRLVVIDVDSFAIANAYTINSENVKENVLMINIGADVTQMVVLEDSVPVVVRDIFIAGNTITGNIQKAMSCDMPKAEDLKLKYGISLKGGTTEDVQDATVAEGRSEGMQVSNAILQALKEFLAEVKRYIDFYTSKNPEKNINRVLISGGCVNLNNLDKYLSQALKLKVEIFNPFSKIKGAKAVPPHIAPQFAVAVGLACRREKDS